jgi:hypothetical protein
LDSAKFLQLIIQKAMQNKLIVRTSSELQWSLHV